MAQKPKVELLAHWAEAEMGTRLTGATLKRARTMRKPEEGRSPVEAKGWRVEVQLEKTMAEAERQPTEVDPEGRGIPEESQDSRAMVDMRERRARAEPMA